MSLVGRWIGGFAREDPSAPAVADPSAVPAREGRAAAAFVLIDVRCIGRSPRREPLPRDSADTSDGRA